jgi:hypothetical protein
MERHTYLSLHSPPSLCTQSCQHEQNNAAWGALRLRTNRRRIGNAHDGGETESIRQQVKLKVTGLKGDAKKIAAVEAAARAVLEARAKYPTSTLADIDDPAPNTGSEAVRHAPCDDSARRFFASLAAFFSLMVLAGFFLISLCASCDFAIGLTPVARTATAHERKGLFRPDGHAPKEPGLKKTLSRGKV